MDNFTEQFDDFLKDTEKDKNKLRLLIDDIGAPKYSYTGMKLTDVEPIYSNNRVKIYIPEKRNSSNNNLF